MKEISLNLAYKLLAPRPTVIVTTISKDGIVNAAPFSFTMPISMDPPIVAFASVPEHDTTKNIKETKEFVMNLVHEDIIEMMWITAKKFPRDVNELEKANLTEIKSKVVSPPKIKESFGHLECKAIKIEEIGDHCLIVGKVVNATVKKNCIKDELLNVEKIKPVLHVGGKKFVIGDHVRFIHDI
ncbi:flavin reductase domain protein FMN-binding protein [Methanothermus fervidus DSM 2088]|uniref:Flavin reductase domain protein FMN-binding protein n=1 Tax=Methanothermus fervidus (strain ATCC 43054 / DSM 2088 / JCM 10308 / V24 S) TaxID=523846 RepID=E3GX84_METFV|nr:flavin reductase family protein [Methanothermus fervidus]ADP78079.1 flavin reductase domain protein FMN-binding protein [Methanothermus fervidus DSM 2088]